MTLRHFVSLSTSIARNLLILKLSPIHHISISKHLLDWNSLISFQGTTNETFGVKFKEVGNDTVDIIDNINVEGTIFSAGLSSSGTQFLESHEDDEIPYDTLPVRRREFSKPCTDEVDVLHYQSDETETYNNTVTDYLSNNLPTATKDDGLIQQHDIGTKTDVCVTSTESLSSSTETLKAETLGSCSMSQNDSDTDFTMPLSSSAETLYAETQRSCLMSQGELEADLTMTLSSQTKTFKVESLVDCSMAQNEFKADSNMPLNPSAETLKAETLARCSMPHSDADSTVHLSHLAETVTADTLSGYSTSKRELDADSTMTLSPSAETLKAEPLVTCSKPQSELDADSTIDHDTVVPMQEKSPETDTKHHRLRCLLQDELARVNYAFRTTHYNDDNEVVLRSKARTSLQTYTERKTGRQAKT